MLIADLPIERWETTGPLPSLLARFDWCLCQGYHAKWPAVRMEIQHPRSIFVTPAHWTFHALRTIIMHNSS